MNEPAILYTRVSPRPTHKEDSCESIGVQVDRCSRYAAMNDLEIGTPLKDEFVSARKTALFERPYGRLLKEIRNQDVIAMKLDRLFRDVADGFSCVEHFEKRKVRLHIADEGGNCFRTDTALGYMMFGQALLYAAFEPRITAERTSRALLHRQSTNRAVSAKPRYGWRLADPSIVTDARGHRSLNDPTLIEDPEEQQGLEIIRDLLPEFTRKNGTVRYRELCRELDRLGVPCRAAEKWRHGLLQKIVAREE
jgi:DNA invertase Pin-like site-specific DNA recombinase